LEELQKLYDTENDVYRASFRKVSWRKYRNNFWVLPKTNARKNYDLIEKNNQFADGLGVGLGRNFESEILLQDEPTVQALDLDLKQEILEKAKHNSELTRGLGTGIGLRFKSLDSKLQEAILLQSQENSEFAFGLGCGLGRILPRFDCEVRQEIYEWAREDGQFAYGLGIYLTLG
jgi:hypothetical protein